MAPIIHRTPVVVYNAASAEQVAWPDFPTVEMPEPSGALDWPEAAKIRVPMPSSADEVKPTARDFPSDDEMAREHVARGFETARQRLIDQARWEFEQARDLADDEDVARMAQRQIDALADQVEGKAAVASPLTTFPNSPRKINTKALNGLAILVPRC